MAMVDVDDSSYRRTHSSSWFAWSDGWRPPGTESAFIIWTGWTLAMALCRDDNTIKIVMVIIIIIIITEPGQPVRYSQTFRGSWWTLVSLLCTGNPLGGSRWTPVQHAMAWLGQCDQMDITIVKEMTYQFINWILFIMQPGYNEVDGIVWLCLSYVFLIWWLHHRAKTGFVVESYNSDRVKCRFFSLQLGLQQCRFLYHATAEAGKILVRSYSVCASDLWDFLSVVNIVVTLWLAQKSAGFGFSFH